MKEPRRGVASYLKTKKKAFRVGGDRDRGPKTFENANEHLTVTKGEASISIQKMKPRHG